MNENKNTMLADGFENAIIGLDVANDVFRVIYDRQKMIDILVHGDGMPIDDAIEYLEFNVWNTYVGEGTPIYALEGGHEFILELINRNK